jgi:hypothetical protein
MDRDGVDRSTTSITTPGVGFGDKDAGCAVSRPQYASASLHSFRRVFFVSCKRLQLSNIR